jgi:thiamine-phosphate pyrophosphorylase
VKDFSRVQLYCFSPGHLGRGRPAEHLIRSQIKGGADVIQLREKNKSKREKLELGFMIRRITREEGVLFIVNDDLDLALILEADGLHLGQTDIPIKYARPHFGEKIIGVSTHSLEQAKKAIEEGADYIGVGPIFPTSTKENPDEVVGPGLITQVAAFSPVPIVAIGGITLKNLGQVIQAGGRCVAVVSDILNAENVEDQARLFKARLSSGHP